MTAYNRFEDIPLYRFGLIMADPPWSFQNWGDPSARAAETHYGTMSLEDIRALPVERIAAPDAWLWLWATGANLRLALGVLDAWGFTYVTSGHWTKTQKANPARPRMGLGHVLRDCGEPYLIGRIGSPKVEDKGIPSVIMAPRREHSRKPEEAYSNAERLAPEGSWMLDMFSRQGRPGWDSFGNETGKFETEGATA
jgi:N6-adenosine-specific RNA methylase IME4